jgi:uncharacterized repeat protein (TIGR01451 family)
VQLDAGSYTVSEAAVSGYTASYSHGCTGTLAAGGHATCTVTNNDDPHHPAPPPPPTHPTPPTHTPTPPSTVSTPPSVDLSIVKTDRPDSVLVGARLEYTLVVTNLSSIRATNVVVSDEIPAQLEFLSVSTTQGTCTGGRVVTCHLGTLEPHATATIIVVVRPLSPGIVINTARVNSAESDANLADNASTAPTLVEAAFQPPRPVCAELLVDRRVLTVGRRATIIVRVRINRLGVRGARLSARGAGVRAAGRTNAAGTARIAVRPTRTGIIVVRLTSQPAHCSVRRIGVAGIFRPPSLTG